MSLVSRSFPATLQMMWILMKRSNNVSLTDWTMDLPMLWKPETSRIFRPWQTKLLCSRIGEEYCQASTSRSARVNRAPTPGPASISILRLLDLPSTPSHRVLNECLNQLEKDLSPPQQQMIPCPNLFQTPNSENQNVQRTPTDPNATQTLASKKSYNYGQKGHFANSSPNPRARPPLIPVANSTPPPNHNGNSTPTQAKQNYTRGRVN
jgi:hypothetical protein